MRESTMRIRELRVAAHLYPEQLAEAMGVCRTAVVNWETGAATPEKTSIREADWTLNNL